MHLHWLVLLVPVSDEKESLMEATCMGLNECVVADFGLSVVLSKDGKHLSFAVIVSDFVSLVPYLVASGMLCLLTVPIRALGENVVC